MHRHIITMALLASTTTTLAQTPTPAPPPSPSPTEIVAAAPPSDWRAIPASDLLIMTLAPDAQGRERRAIIQLMPAPFSEGWVANIRTLARAHWWDGLAVVRVQDNYVTQWGDPDGEDAARARALPAGLRTMTEQEYTTERLISREIADANGLAWQDMAFRFLQNALIAADAQLEVPAEFEQAMESGNADNIPEPALPNLSDRYAAVTSHLLGWPIGNNGVVEDQRYWPVHCYGMVGVGRNLSPDTGSGAELYTVIGHAPRHLDRNIALVGRVIEGMQHLSSLPRGTGPLGFYETPAERTTITSIRLASDLPAAEQPRFHYLSTESQSFGLYADARANRRDPFFIRPAGGADICNIPVPVRRVPG
jgi:cyclophilin family peptidyl-prolyl cis-trans isomerase